MHPWRSLGALPRDLWILAGARPVNRAGTMVLPFLALYLTRRLGISASAAGALLALWGAAELVTAPIAGRLCDRFGALPVMTLSLLASAALMVVYPLATPPPGGVPLRRHPRRVGRVRRHPRGRVRSRALRRGISRARGAARSRSAGRSPLR